MDVTSPTRPKTLADLLDALSATRANRSTIDAKLQIANVESTRYTKAELIAMQTDFDCVASTVVALESLLKEMGSPMNPSDPCPCDRSSIADIVCPRCQGQKRLAAFVDGRDPATGRAWGGTRMVPCSTCNANGYITDAQRDAIEAGAHRRADRIQRRVSLAQEAAALGMSTMELAAIETGRDVSEAKRRHEQSQATIQAECDAQNLPVFCGGVEMKLVVGDTYPVKEDLKRMGGYWDANAKGWRVPAPRYEDARELLGFQQEVLPR